MSNINVIRVRTRLHELFEPFVDMSDAPPESNNSLFETRAIAALALMMRCQLEPEQACIHITDGYHDMGIDAIYLDETQKELFVVQSKWRNSGNGNISQTEMTALVEGLKRIFDFDLDGANERIQRKTGDIDIALTRIGYQIHALFIHTGDFTESSYANRPITDLMNATNDDVSTLLLYEEIPLKILYSYLAEGQRQERLQIDDVILNNWGKIETPYPAYYGLIAASAVGEWYKTFGSDLFAKNIRYYKGNTDVNEGMRRTLLEEPENFFYYNNGIKVLCSSITRKAKDSTTSATGLFALDGVSLVNGAQTAGTIGNVFSTNPEQVAKAVLMIELIDLSGAPDEAYIQITKLSNTQNRIENKDFASLDPEQERIRAELSFSSYTYLYKSGDKLTSLDNEITFDEAIVALACLYPDVSYSTTAKRSTGALTEDITKAPYKALINPSTNSFVLLNSSLCIRHIERVLQSKRSELSGRARLACIHGNRFIEHCVLHYMQRVPGFDTSVLSIDVIGENTQQLVERILPITTDVMNRLFLESYPANIFKNAAKCRAIKDAVLSE